MIWVFTRKREGEGWGWEGKSRGGTKSSASLGDALPEPFDLGRGVRPEVDCAVEAGAQGRVLDLAGVGAVVIKVRFWRRRVEGEGAVAVAVAVKVEEEERAHLAGTKRSDGRREQENQQKLFFAASLFPD